MSAKLDVNSIKNVLPRDVVGDSKGKEACKKVSDYVKAQGWTGPVRFWDSDLWVAAESMSHNPEIKSHGGWNGGFDTKLGYALNGHTAAEIKAAQGTGVTRTPSDGTPNKRAYKLSVAFNMELGTAEFDLGENADPVTFDSGSMTFNGITRTTASAYGRKLLDLLSDVRTAIKNAAETRDGNLVQAGFAYGGYASTAADAVAAGQDILRQAMAKLDSDTMDLHRQLMKGELVIATGTGLKNDWVAAYLPEPVKEPEPEPVQPSEVAPEPQSIPMMGDGGVDTSAKPAQPAQPAKRGKIITK